MHSEAVGGVWEGSRGSSSWGVAGGRGWSLEPLLGDSREGPPGGVKTTLASSSSGPAVLQVLCYFPFIIPNPLHQPLQAGRAISILQTRLNEVL